MAEKKLKCNSCNVDIANIEGSTKFLCPKCGKYEIVRCYDCRKLGVKYTCKMCGFTGPN